MSVIMGPIQTTPKTWKEIFELSRGAYVEPNTPLSNAVFESNNTHFRQQMTDSLGKHAQKLSVNKTRIIHFGFDKYCKYVHLYFVLFYLR